MKPKIKLSFSESHGVIQFWADVVSGTKSEYPDEGYVTPGDKIHRVDVYYSLLDELEKFRFNGNGTFSTTDYTREEITKVFKTKYDIV